MTQKAKTNNTQQQKTDKVSNNAELDTNLDIEESLRKEALSPELDEPYIAPNQLYVPQEAKDYFNGLGFDLQWVRVYEDHTDGRLDQKNIISKENDKYSFVKRSDVPGLGEGMTSFFGEEIDKSSNGLYIVGNLALAKVPFKVLEQKRRFNERRTELLNKSVMGDLKKADVLPDANRGEGWKIEEDRPRGNKQTQFG